MPFQPGNNLVTQNAGLSPQNVGVPHLDVRDPTSSDSNPILYPQGKTWLNTLTGSYFVLAFSTTSQGITSATWAQLSSSSGDVQQLTSDSGIAVASSGNINVLGGSGVSTSATGSTLTINTTGGGFDYTVVTANTQMAIDQGYIANKAGTACVLTLPATAVVGSSVAVVGLGATGWSIAQNSGQVIHINAASTTTGAGGSLASIDQYNSVQLICVVANTDWVATNGMGILTVT